MKKIKILPTLVFLIILLVAVGCQKPVGPTPTPPKAPQVSIKVVPSGQIIYADSVQLSWTVTGQVTFTELNGKKVAQNGNFTSPRLLADQDYTLRATGPGGSDSKTVTVKVGDWTTSRYGLISHGPWTFGSWFVSFTSDTSGFEPIDPDPSFIGMQYDFSPNGDYYESLASGKILYSTKWRMSVEGDTIIIGTEKPYKIVGLSASSIILVQEAPSNVGKAWTKWTYKRNSSK